VRFSCGRKDLGHLPVIYEMVMAVVAEFINLFAAITIAFFPRAITPPMTEPFSLNYYTSNDGT
jgi:hypothetical protein